MSKLLQIISITIIVLFSSCINTSECEKLLTKEVDSNSIKSNKQEFIEDLELLIDCEFEPIDKEILFGNNDSEFIVDYFIIYFDALDESSSPEKKITFKEIKTIIEDLKNTEEYLIAKQTITIRNQIQDKEALLSNWKTDSVLLVQMNFTEIDISKIKFIVAENMNKGWTYYDVFVELQSQYQTTNTMECPAPSYTDRFFLPYNLDGFFELSEGIECSKISNRPILLYFTGHGSVKSREFESKVLSDADVLQLLKQKYIIVSLYVDDRSLAIPKYFIAPVPACDTLKLIGEINSYYQKTLFNDVVQPAFYIIDSMKNLLDKPYYYNSSNDSFKEFLKKGVNQYYK